MKGRDGDVPNMGAHMTIYNKAFSDACGET